MFHCAEFTLHAFLIYVDMLQLEPDRLRLLKNRDSDYLAILATFQDYQLPILTKSNLFFRLLLDYQLPISGNVIGNLDYQFE